MRIFSSEIPLHIGKEVHLRGWLNNVRSLGKLNFLILRDKGGLVQIVIEEAKEFAKLKALFPGSILSIKGMAVRNERIERGFEIIHPHIHCEVPVLEPPEIEYYKPEIPSDLDFILDHRPLALRNRKLQAVFRIQAEIAHAYRLYMHDKVGASEYFAPNIIGASSEGGAEFFNVDYFGYEATLAQSSQLYKQIMVGVNERVFALMPFFRAEPSHTTRHLTEGKQFEFEMGFFDHWHEILDVQEGVIKAIIAHLEKTCREELEALGAKLPKVKEEVKFPRISFKEALEISFKRTGVDERGEPDLSPSSERAICEWAEETLGTDFVFVIDWKTEKRPFYSYPKEEDPTLTNTFDLICAGSEITSGGQRRHTFASMKEGIESKGMNPDNFQDYLSIFKGGMPSHGGFGMGLERLTMKLLKLGNIREASLFPSDTKRIAGNRIRAKIVFGAENMRNEIIRRLRDFDITYEHKVHEPTPTSEDSARVRGMPLGSGIKAIIVRGKKTKKNFQFNIPADMRLDMKIVADIVGEKCEFEAPEVIKERYGLIIGGIPPFGKLLGIDTYFDEKIEALTKVAFNCGLVTESIIMTSSDLIKAAEPKLYSLVG